MGKKSSTTPLENRNFDWKNYKAESVDFSELEATFSLRERDQIIKYLASNTYLRPLISETVSILQRYFPDTKFALHRYVDPEIVGLTRLVIEIPTKYSPQEALSKLNEFDDEWWIENEYRSNGNLTVNVEFL